MAKKERVCGTTNVIEEPVHSTDRMDDMKRRGRNRRVVSNYRARWWPTEAVKALGESAES
jgi:hypothetical protein